MNDTSKQPPKTLKALISDAQLTQKDFAARVGCDQSLISFYINGKKTPGLDKAIAMAATLGVSLKVLARSLGYEVDHVPNDIAVLLPVSKKDEQ